MFTFPRDCTGRIVGYSEIGVGGRQSDGVWSNVLWKARSAIGMTVEEALADIEKLGHGGLTTSRVAQQETSCHDTQQAVMLLAEAYGHLRKRDPLYADQRRCASAAPPPASVPPD